MGIRRISIACFPSITRSSGVGGAIPFVTAGGFVYKIHTRERYHIEHVKVKPIPKEMILLEFDRQSYHEGTTMCLTDIILYSLYFLVGSYGNSFYLYLIKPPSFSFKPSTCQYFLIFVMIAGQAQALAIGRVKRIIVI